MHLASLHQSSQDAVDAGCQMGEPAPEEAGYHPCTDMFVVVCASTEPYQPAQRRS